MWVKGLDICKIWQIVSNIKQNMESWRFLYSQTFVEMWRQGSCYGYEQIRSDSEHEDMKSLIE